jgi:hypothetical protein
MKELIHIQAGQCGLQIGEQLWDLYAREHGINPDGTSESSEPGSNPNVLFTESCSGKWRPRAVLVDSEDSVIMKILNKK